MMEKKKQALEFAQNCADSQNQAPCTSKKTACKTQAQEFKPGQFVALVQEGSTLKLPKCLVGRVLFYTDQDNCNEVQLLWYKNVKGSAYKLDFDGSPWVESTDSMIAVELCPSKKIPDQYTLLTAPRTIHKRVFTSD